MRSEGSYAFGFSGAMGGVMKCDAPKTGDALSLKVSGKVLNPDTMDARFNLDAYGKGKVSSALRCTALGGYKVTAPLEGPTDKKSATAGTPVREFSMPLGDGQKRVWNLQRGPGVTSRATVTLYPAGVQPE